MNLNECPICHTYVYNGVKVSGPLGLKTIENLDIHSEVILHFKCIIKHKCHKCNKLRYPIGTKPHYCYLCLRSLCKECYSRDPKVLGCYDCRVKNAKVAFKMQMENDIPKELIDKIFRYGTTVQNTIQTTKEDVVMLLKHYSYE